MSEENKNLVRLIYEEILNKKNLDAIDQVFAGDMLFRAPNLPETRGGEAHKQLVAAIHKAFPDISYTVQDVIAEGDKVVTRKTFSGTHKGDFMGVPPTGKKGEIGVIDIFCIANGRIAEHWMEGDNLGLMQQLGIIPPPGQGR